MNTQLDLQQLAIERPAPPSSSAPRRRHLMTRYLIPAAVLLGFVSMLAWAARDRLMPSTPVTVVPVVVTRAEVHTPGTPLFQAPGWIEPRPAPVLVSALAEGVIEELLVVEGEEVQAGQTVARLIDTDARIALKRAGADLQLQEAELAGAEAELTAARLRMEQPVHLEAALAKADSLLAKVHTEQARLPARVRAAEARLRFAREHLEGKQTAGGAVAGRLLQEAQSQYDNALAEVDELETQRPRVQQEVEALQRQRDAAAKQLELKIEEAKQWAAAEARVQAATARRRQAQLALEAAELQRTRMAVLSPITGRVLQAIARPGSRMMGLTPNSAHDASTLMSLYDPKMLQVRADVRLEDVPNIQPGQPVRIETASASAPIRGKVLQATSRANIQKNTLEVKVTIESPPPTVRPEMLVQVTFLAAESAGSGWGDSQPPQRLLIPRQLVETGPQGTLVWIADPAGVARRQEVKLGTAGTDELVEVLEGLRNTDKLICDGRERLSDGRRIRITGEDSSVGVKR